MSWAEIDYRASEAQRLAAEIRDLCTVDRYIDPSEIVRLTEQASDKLAELRQMVRMMRSSAVCRQRELDKLRRML